MFDFDADRTDFRREKSFTKRKRRKTVDRTENCRFRPRKTDFDQRTYRRFIGRIVRRNEKRNAR